MLVKRGKRFCWNWLWLGLFGVGIALFLIVTPKYHDDYWYMWGASEWYASQGITNPNQGGDIFRYGIPWEGINATIRYHISTDNGRLCNIAAPFVLLFPKWLISSVATLFLFFAVWGGFRIADVDINRSWLTAIGIGLWVLTFYWYDYMGSAVYQFNYLISSGLAVGFLYILKNDKSSVSSTMGLLLLAAILSVWHEGFSVPLIVSMLVVTVCFKRCRNWRNLLALLILSAGLIWHFGYTYTWQLVLAGSLQPNLHRLMSTLWYQKGMWVALVVSICWLVKYGPRRYFTDWVNLFLLTSIIVSFGLAYYSTTPRAATWGEVCSIILSVRLLAKSQLKASGYGGWRGIVACIVLLVSGCQLAWADAFAIEFAREMPRLIDNFKKNPQQAQFSNIVDYPWQGSALQQMTPYPLFRSGSYFIAQYFDLYSGKDMNFRVVPESLRKVHFRDTKPLEGNLGFRKYGSFILLPGGPAGIHYLDKLNLQYDGYVLSNQTGMGISFKSEGDGMEYVYVMPLNQPGYEIGELQGVSREEGLEPMSDEIGKLGRRESLRQDIVEKYRNSKP